MRLKIPKLRDKVWTKFSQYIRLRDSKEGICTCCTCGTKDFITRMNAGHFQHGKNKETYFDERNVHAQCPRCNLYFNGALDSYTLFIIDKYGREVCDELIEKGRRQKIWKRQELEDLFEYYKGDK